MPIKKNRATIVLALSAACLFATSASATRYEVDRTVGAATVSGYIETDGTLGMISGSNLVDWSLQIVNGSESVTLRGPASGDNSVFGQVGLLLTATPDQLLQSVSAGVSGIQFCLENTGFPNVCNIGQPNWFLNSSGEFVEIVRDFPTEPDQQTGPAGAPGDSFVIATADADTDADGVPDAADNCIEVANPDQRDTDGDAIGNACDADVDGDCSVNFGDLALLKGAFFPQPYDENVDFDGNGLVNFGDLAIMKATFFNGPNPGPGPSGLPNDCG